MEASSCPFKDFGIYIILGGIGFLAVVLLAAFGRKRCRCSDYIFGAWSLIAFSTHMMLDSYFLYTPRLMRLAKDAKEPVPKQGDYAGCFVAHVRRLWREYADADTRMYMDEFQPMIQATAYGLAIGGSILCFLTFLGHLTGGKWTHPMQIAASTWQLGLLYAFCMPEYMVGFTHVKDMKMFAAGNLPFVIMAALALLVSLGKMCGCCSEAGAGVCPFVSKKAATFPEKKKQ